MSPIAGRLALHGGGEFRPGDEPFLRAVLAAAGESSASVSSGDDPVATRVALIPTAAARGEPGRAAAAGCDALRRIAVEMGLAMTIDVTLVLDVPSAADPSIAKTLAEADLIYFPGGDPDIIPALLPASLAGRAVDEARRRGALVAGASAGAMAMADWTWTPDGVVRGLGWLPSIVVLPHFEGVPARGWRPHLASTLVGSDVGELGLDEATGMIQSGDGWLVAGAGAVHWYAPGCVDPVVARDGERIRLVG